MSKHYIISGARLDKSCKDKRPLYRGDGHYCYMYYPDKTEYILYTANFDSNHQVYNYHLFEDNDLVFTTTNDFTITQKDFGSGQFRMHEGIEYFEKFFYNMLIATPYWTYNYCHDTVNKIEQLDKRGVFIGGCGRSGTTLLTSILGAHSSIYSIPNEKHAFYPYNGIKKIYNEIKDDETHLFYVEKTPKNVLSFDRIQKIIPNSKTIHIVRDCRDVITSHHPTKKKKYWVSVDRWVHDVTEGLKSKNTLLIKYEDLINNFEQTMTKIVDYLGIHWEDNFHEYYKYTSLKSNIAWDGNATPITNKSIGRWKMSKYRNKIKKEVYSNEKALKLLETLGYE